MNIWSFEIAIFAFLAFLQGLFFFAFKKEGVSFSDFDRFHNEYGGWWFFKKPSLAFRDRFAWIVMLPSYLLFGSAIAFLVIDLIK